MASPATIYSPGQAKNIAAHRAVPLNTRQIVSASFTLCVFSFFYLSIAQQHSLIFYTMTGLIGVYILLVYASGIAAVLYMVAREYPNDDFDGKSTNSSFRDVEESKI